MIEDRIQILRRAAQISAKDKNEKVWCIIAGNDRLLDDIAYNAITSKDRVKIIFRETITLSSRHTAKKFDCILLHGEALKISELSNKSREEGGASIEITSRYLETKPNLLIEIGPEDNMKKFVGETNRKNTDIEILLEDHTTGFIKSELKSSIKIPNFLKNTITPILDTTEVILSIILISVKEEENIEKVKEISQENYLFGLDLKKTIQDKNYNKEIKKEGKDKKDKENKENKENKEENTDNNKNTKEINTTSKSNEQNKEKGKEDKEKNTNKTKDTTEEKEKDKSKKSLFKRK